jgi:hypothetical protein
MLCLSLFHGSSRTYERSSRRLASNERHEFTVTMVIRCSPWFQELRDFAFSCPLRGRRAVEPWFSPKFHDVFSLLSLPCRDRSGKQDCRLHRTIPSDAESVAFFPSLPRFNFEIVIVILSYPCLSIGARRYSSSSIVPVSVLLQFVFSGTTASQWSFSRPNSSDRLQFSASCQTLPWSYFSRGKHRFILPIPAFPPTQSHESRSTRHIPSDRSPHPHVHSLSIVRP